MMILLGFTVLQLATHRIFAQRVGTIAPESPPSFRWSKCTTSGGCTTTEGRVIIEANYRWFHDYKGYTNCYALDKWDTTLCPDGKTCADNCAIEGVDYPTYGVSTSANTLTIKTVSPNRAPVGTRLLLANSNGYELFKPLNQEIAFDVDVSQLYCGWDGALSFVHMDADGGLSKYPSNKAGWKYGTGYCDSTCARNQMFINGEVRCTPDSSFIFNAKLTSPQANVKNWTPSNSSNFYASQGYYGSCCNELSIWEANSMATTLTAHPCNKTVTSQMRCEGDLCNSGKTCDAVGCDFNPYRLGNPTYYGKGKTVNSSSKLTVVTQFISSTGTSSGSLSEIRRVYVQNGRVIANAKVNLPGVSPYDSITDEYGNAEKAYFNETNTFKEKGGLSGSSLSQSAASGMVLTISLTKMFDDRAHPFDKSDIKTANGYYSNGPCMYGAINNAPIDTDPSSGTQSMILSNLKFGDIGSTSLAH
ncbi:glycoside hydrolase family 7 protein [Panaeolus papilionaceus]|nr:glycoside hydrolase family 7 protein [Panaeolus papilionaceus]